MGDTPNSTKRSAKQYASPSNETNEGAVGAFSLSESFQKTLSEMDQKISHEFLKVQSAQNEQHRLMGDTPQVIEELLDRARIYYSKKDYTKAFSTWEKVCSYLPESDTFRRTVVSLKDSHGNLEKAHQELSKIREDIYARFSPSSTDRQFVEKAQDGVNGQIKNAYSHISREIRSERAVQPLSFWWPVFLALSVVAGGGSLLWGYHTNRLAHGSVPSGQAAALTAQTAAEIDMLKLELSSVTAERDVLKSRIEGVDQETESKLSEARRQAAESAKNERERIIQLETRLREKEEEARQLQDRVDFLTQDNLDKERVIQTLN